MAGEVFIFTTGSHNFLALYIHEMSEANQESPDTTVPVSGPRPPAPPRMVPQHSQAPVMPLSTVHMIQRPMLGGQVPRPPFANPFEGGL